MKLMVILIAFFGFGIVHAQNNSNLGCYHVVNENPDGTFFLDSAPNTDFGRVYPLNSGVAKALDQAYANKSIVCLQGSHGANGYFVFKVTSEQN